MEQHQLYWLQENTGNNVYSYLFSHFTAYAEKKVFHIDAI